MNFGFWPCFQGRFVCVWWSFGVQLVLVLLIWSRLEVGKGFMLECNAVKESECVRVCLLHR
jgi:hypothetical protein